MDSMTIIAVASIVMAGITTGFGKFCDVVINEDSNALLQKNLIMSHAVGVGQEMPQAVGAYAADAGAVKDFIAAHT